MKNKSCGVCGYTLSEFYATGMLGCPECYKAFKPEVIASIKKVQNGNTKHYGSSDIREKEQMLSDYKRLNVEKEKAISEGRFSDSAKIADDIFALSEELKAMGVI